MHSRIMLTWSVFNDRLSDSPELHILRVVTLDHKGIDWILRAITARSYVPIYSLSGIACLFQTKPCYLTETSLER